MGLLKETKKGKKITYDSEIYTCLGNQGSTTMYRLSLILFSRLGKIWVFDQNLEGKWKSLRFRNQTHKVQREEIMRDLRFAVCKERKRFCDKRNSEVVVLEAKAKRVQLRWKPKHWNCCFIGSQQPKL